MREWRCSSIILDLDIRWNLVVSFTPRLLYPRRNSPCYPSDRRLCEPRRRYGHCGEEKDLLPLPAIEPQFLGRPTPSLSLYRPLHIESEILTSGSLYVREQHPFWPVAGFNQALPRYSSDWQIKPCIVLKCSHNKWHVHLWQSMNFNRTKMRLSK
jgi:hypothetical protein